MANPLWGCVGASKMNSDSQWARIATTPPNAPLHIGRDLSASLQALARTLLTSPTFPFSLACNDHDSVPCLDMHGYPHRLCHSCSGHMNSHFFPGPCRQHWLRNRHAEKSGTEHVVKARRVRWMREHREGSEDSQRLPPRWASCSCVAPANTIRSLKTDIASSKKASVPNNRASLSCWQKTFNSAAAISTVRDNFSFLFTARDVTLLSVVQSKGLTLDA